MRSALASRLLALLALAALTLGVRMINHQRVAPPPDGSGGPAPGWVMSDPDSYYHLRRVARALEDGRVAGTDPLLPRALDPEGKGGPIPWPPYATWWNAGAVALMGALLGQDPGAPTAGAIEQRVGSLPMLWAVLGALLAFGWAERLAGKGSATRRAVAWFAGLSFAFNFASLRYSYWGMGDHHACASFLIALSLALAAGCGWPGARSGRAALLGGAIAGLALGTWVGSWPFVLLAGVALSLSARGWSATLFFGAALASVWPAWATSPWRALDSWSWVEISHAQPLALFIAGLFSGLVRSWPTLWVGLVWGVMGLAAGLLVGGGEVLDWGTASTAFMDSVRESRAPAWSEIFRYLGPTLCLVPFGLVGLLRQRHAESALLLPLGLLALALVSLQLRFSELVALPLMVLAAIGCAPLLARLSSGWLIVVVPLLAAGGQYAGVVETVARFRQGAPYLFTPKSEQLRAVRAGLEWLRDRPRGRSGEGVLAAWDQGHAIEWVARRATAATGFGSYLGEQSFEAPGRFLGARDEAQAEQLMAEGGFRYVLLTSTFARQEAPAPGSVGARLIESVGWADSGQNHQGLTFLRLVYLGPLRIVPADGGPLAGRLQPALAIWERVPGTRLELRGEPGDSYALSLRVHYPLAQRDLIWARGGRLDPSGRAQERVPYALGPVQGGRWLAGRQGQARAALRWRVGSLGGDWEGFGAEGEADPISVLR